MKTDDLVGPEVLGRHHQTAGFDCGAPSLDRYLTQRARVDHVEGTARVYVASRRQRVVGYFSLVPARIEPRDTEHEAAGSGGVVALLIARLAVDKREQRRGLGSALVIDALRRSAAAADSIGAQVVLARATDAGSVALYRKMGFAASPTDPAHAVLRVASIRVSLK